MAPTGMATVERSRLAFCKRLGSLGTSSKHSQSGLYLPLCTANDTSLTPLYGGFFFLLYGRQIELSHSSFQTDSLNLPCGTYTQLCLHLNNPSTNLTSLSTLLLRRSPKNICASG